MATNPGKNIIDAAIVSTTITTIYTVTNNLLRTKIDAITFTNYGSVNADLTVQIVSKGGSSGNEKILIKEKTIRTGESYQAPEIVGQGINEGGVIMALSSIASSISCTATGTEYSG